MVHMATTPQTMCQYQVRVEVQVHFDLPDTPTCMDMKDYANKVYSNDLNRAPVVSGRKGSP